MMTEEILYARLKEALRDAIARHHLDERSISLKSRGLTPEEAIGRTARTDYPILNGREVMLQALFGEALGQAFTSAPVDFEGSLADVLELDTTHDPQAAGMLVATLNAVLRAVGEIGNTVHCRDDGPELCAERYAALVRERFGTPRIALVGFQPALLARLSKEFSVRVLDLNPEIVGTVRSGVLIDSGTVLKVTPHIIPGLPGQADSIKLMVSVQDDRDDGSSLFSVDPNNLSPIKQTKINTQAIVGEGQSLLIGGHYYEIQSDAETGIPGLKNIPILGGLFGSTGKKHQRMERLILITPRIVRMDTASNVPSRVDDPRFSRTPTQADYEERRPKEMPVGGCARRRELAPDVQPAPSVTLTPQPVPVPATNKSIQNSTMPQPILTPVSTGAQPVPAPVGSTSVSAGGRQ